ncbi:MULTISPECIES: helix-turn-helix transcriptional regulator [Gammaproteobacteria]|uniref:helix-turn-helix transcriptional regulator n=1 Tax=Gammaproteobacteria TaxID=1236 RepID=UPI000470A71C|nr:AlpA family phage regulatory protein [Vibrio cholerae]MBP0923851.1 AlpA family phage regulatory protein [Vibrio cholerae]MDY7587426.1 AlpA family phage regulatory protein [Vibrio cholerae]
MSEQTFVLPSEEVRTQVLSQSGQCERLVREPDRKMITGVSRTQWWMMERQGLVPQRVRLSAHCVAWRLSDLLWWIEQREAA